MMLMEQTEISGDALPVDAFKAHLRLGRGFAEDAVQDVILAGFLRAALAAIEARTAKILLARSFQLTLSAWHDATAQPFPVAPVTAVTEVSLVDRDGDELSVDPALYRLEPDTQRPRLLPVASLLPVIPRAGSVRISFDAGMGGDFDALPADLRQAVMLLAAHYYEYRDETALGAGCMPFGVTSLIARYRTVRLLGGGAA
ncbi:head-tail connector protein [Lutimaribacter sp. EGI FJ00015]|uniref:Head-tail connector protein n=1 Tax=Lutimaribacter degradans TaxID=2945989 RepID=A0ACC5ZSW0_9RHOB|nr:head-tail connector protein [Lutimaribacter sp. EGI FJ00013]MCM2561033.1 head-tail connector protein [Lutimaribacter sp. EGI FJ00013]MCO0612020.1 head-tail connector protein [Lutimaribacter sp. EGI FJ00015]MCO0634860.1 head-tail connector protein [Lutimaribacter sp. EGI FJ00014]